MPINSETIRKKEFHIVFKGYKPEEVDKFLDSLSVDFEKIIQKNKEMQEHIDKLKYERNSESDEMKKVIQDALVSAHKIAEEIKEKAETEAKKMYSQKKSESEKEFRALELKKQKLEEDMANIKKQYLGLKQYLEEALKNMGEFEISEDSSINPQLSESQQEPDEPEIEAEQEEPKAQNDKEPDKDQMETLPPENEQPQDTEEEDLNIEKKRNKIDIANPDVIDDFFKADE